MNEIAQRVLSWAQAKGLNQTQLAEALGGKRQMLTNWKTNGVPAAWHQKIADYFGKSVDELLGRQAHELIQIGGNVTSGPPMRMVPVLNTVNAGMYKEIIDAKPEDIEYTPVDIKVGKYAFALEVNGDSMDPGFPDGCIVIVDPNQSPNPNDYVVAMNGDNEATFKQLVKDGGDWYLKPRNTRYPIKPLGSARIIGVVTGLQVVSRPGDSTWPV